MATIPERKLGVKTLALLPERKSEVKSLAILPVRKLGVKTLAILPKRKKIGVKGLVNVPEQYVTFFSRLSVLHFSTEKPQIQPVCIKSDALEGPRSKIRVTQNFY